MARAPLAMRFGLLEPLPVALFGSGRNSSDSPIERASAVRRAARTGLSVMMDVRVPEGTGSVESSGPRGTGYATAAAVESGGVVSIGLSDWSRTVPGVP